MHAHYSEIHTVKWECDQAWVKHSEDKHFVIGLSSEQIAPVTEMFALSVLQ